MARKKSIEAGELTGVAFYILSSLVKESHGYSIMKTVEAFTDNDVMIGPASLYTTLKKLLDAELITLNTNDDKQKKIYQITKIGYDMLTKDIARKQKMIDYAQLHLEDWGNKND